jgi:hypothetical protein
MGAEDMAERIAQLVVEVNTRMRKKGAAGLEVRVVREAGRFQVRTDQVDRDGTRRMRQESPELTPEKAADYLRNILAALGAP